MLFAQSKPSAINRAAQDQLLACVHLSDVSHLPGRVSVRGNVFVQQLSSSRVLEVGSNVIIEPSAADLARRFSALTDAGTPACLKTYLNAAQAVLAELRRRSGTTQVFGPLQPGMN